MPVAVPGASGYPVFDTSKGEGGWHSGPPNLGVGELTADGGCGDPFVPDDVGTCVLVEHAPSTNQQEARNQFEPNRTIRPRYHQAPLSPIQLCIAVEPL